MCTLPSVSRWTGLGVDVFSKQWVLGNVDNLITHKTDEKVGYRLEISIVFYGNSDVAFKKECTFLNTMYFLEYHVLS